MKTAWGIPKNPFRASLAVLMVVGGLLAGERGVWAQAPFGPVDSDSPITMETESGFLLLDVTKKGDKTAPVIKLGYQSLVGDRVRPRRALSPEKDVHDVWYYSLNLTGVPSDDVAHIFSGRDVSRGADVQLSVGQAYLRSYATPLSTSVANTDIKNVSNRADRTELARKNLDAARSDLDKARLVTNADERKLELQRISTVVGTVQKDVAVSQVDITTTSVMVDRHLADAKSAAYKAVYGEIAPYARSVAAYALSAGTAAKELKDAVDELVVANAATTPTYAQHMAAYEREQAAVKPTPPEDPRMTLSQRGGPIYDAWFLRVGFNAGSATLFDPAKPFGDQFQKREYNGYSLQGGYNIRCGGRFPVIVGLAGGLGRASNVDQLKSVEATDTQTFTSTDGTIERVTTKKRAGLVGEFKEETGGLAKIDVVLYPGLAAASRDGKDPKSTIAIDLFSRVQKGAPLSYGIGAYVTKAGSPTSIYGGLNLYRGDDKKLAIDLVGGIPF